MKILLQGKATDAENVVRVKAAARNFSEETNLSVITEDGRFYNFDVCYSDYPETLNVDFFNHAANTSNAQDAALFKELGNDPASLAGQAMESIYICDKRFIRHIGSESFGIQFLLKGIYTQNGKLYFHTQIRNNTHTPFTIDFITFKVIDKKIVRRTVIQERVIEPLRVYRTAMDEVAGTSTEPNVYLLEQITIPDDKVLMIDLFEKNGGRHQSLKIENTDLVKARLIKKMHLKI